MTVGAGDTDQELAAAHLVPGHSCHLLLLLRWTQDNWSTNTRKADTTAFLQFSESHFDELVLKQVVTSKRVSRHMAINKE